MSIFYLLFRPIITSGNVLLVQFVSDLSVTSDGFLAHYTSIPRGSQVVTVDSGAGTRSVPPKPAARATVQPPVPTPKYVPLPPAERPKPVKPARGRGQDTTGQGRRVPVARPNGKRPGEWSYGKTCVCEQKVSTSNTCLFFMFYSPSKSTVC